MHSPNRNTASAMYPTARPRSTRNAAASASRPACNDQPPGRQHARPKAPADTSSRSRTARQDPAPVPLQNGIGPGKDQKEMEVDHRHEHREEREGVDQGGLGDDLGPVITSHEGADRDDADGKEQLRRVVIGPLPEDPRADGEDQQLLEKPHARPVISPRGRILNEHLGGMALLRLLHPATAPRSCRRPVRSSCGAPGCNPRNSARGSWTAPMASSESPIRGRASRQS